ncbi:hypothetical protein ACLBR5_32585 [Escherichia coli]
MMSRWLHYPDWVTIIAQQVLIERGQRYASRLQNEFAGNISALADAENISRKIITRCINTAKLPKSVVALFLTPVNYLPGQVMHFKKPLQIKRNYLSSRHLTLHQQKKAGVIFEAEEVITLLTSVLKTSSASRTSLSFTTSVCSWSDSIV